jgi:hypothetical protein
MHQISGRLDIQKDNPDFFNIQYPPGYPIALTDSRLMFRWSNNLFSFSSNKARKKFTKITQVTRSCFVLLSIIVKAVFIKYVRFYQKYRCQAKYPTGYPALTGYPEFLFRISVPISGYRYRYILTGIELPVLWCIWVYLGYVQFCSFVIMILIGTSTYFLWVYTGTGIIKFYNITVPGWQIWSHSKVYSPWSVIRINFRDSGSSCGKLKKAKYGTGRFLQSTGMHWYILQYNFVWQQLTWSLLSSYGKRKIATGT